MSVTLPSALYRQHVASGLIKPDDAQSRALVALDRLVDELTGIGTVRPLWRRLLNFSKDAPRGLYMYGPVGRGKSYLMDLLLECVPQGVKVQRQHFHQFMRDVHHRLEKARRAGSTDPLALVTADLVASTQLLCFDELFVKDVADAMILGRLFGGLIHHGVIIVFTTNVAPDDLYKGGLQRVRFQSFIDLVKQELDVIEVAGAHDYRQERLAGAPTYLTPLGIETSQALNAIFGQLTQGLQPQPATLLVEGRQLQLNMAAGGVLKTSFAELCESPLGANDYLEIAACFNTVVIDGVPLMVAEKRNEAMRFITLIDALYDAHRQLVIGAAALPEQLYTGGPLAFEFQRTASRLREMQAADYQGQNERYVKGA